MFVCSVAMCLHILILHFMLFQKVSVYPTKWMLAQQRKMVFIFCMIVSWTGSGRASPCPLWAQHRYPGKQRPRPNVKQWSTDHQVCTCNYIIVLGRSVCLGNIFWFCVLCRRNEHGFGVQMRINLITMANRPEWLTVMHRAQFYDKARKTKINFLFITL